MVSLIVCLSYPIIQAEEVAVLASDNRTALYNELQDLVAQEKNDIALIIQQLVHKLSLRADSQKKCAALSQLTHIRSCLDTFHALEKWHDEAGLKQLLELHEVLLGVLACGIENDLTELPLLDQRALPKRSMIATDVALEDLLTLYARVQNKMYHVMQDMKALGRSRMQQYIKSAEDTVQQFHLDTIAKHSWPYLVLTAYWFYIKPETDFDKEKFSRFKKIKMWITGIEDKSKVNQEFEIDKDKSKLFIKTDKTEMMNSGISGFIKNYCGGIFKIDCDDTLYKLSVPSLVSPFIINDAYEVSRWGVKKVKKWHDQFIGAELDAPEMIQTSEVPLTYAERCAMCDKLLKRWCITPESMNIDRIAGATVGCSAKTLEVIITEACVTAQHLQEVTSMAHIEQCIDNHVRHITNSPVNLTECEKVLLATGLAGEAVASVLLKPRVSLSKITLLPIMRDNGTTYGAVFTYGDDQYLGMYNKDELLKSCSLACAQAVAQELLHGSASYMTLKNCKERAFALAHTIVLEGMNEAHLPQTLRDEKLTQAWQIVDTCYKKATQLLNKNYKQLECVVKELHNKLTLDVDEITKLITK